MSTIKTKQLEISGKITTQHHSTNMKQNKKWHDIEQMIIIVKRINLAMRFPSSGPV